MRNTAVVGSLAGEVQRLRAQLERVQGRRLDPTVLPVSPALAGLLPGRGLRPGAAYALSPSATLLFALLAVPSQSGSWCAAIGMPQLGAEAAERAGVELSRLVLVPDPGERWLAVTAAVAEVVPVVALHAPSRARDADVSRLSARLRDRGAVLLVQGPWPQAEASIELSGARWRGLGAGHGLLAERSVTVTVSSRRAAGPRRARLLLPAVDGAVAGDTAAVRDAGASRDEAAVRPASAEPILARAV